MVPKGFERREFAGNLLDGTPKPGKIVNIAGDGRQREVIWDISDNTAQLVESPGGMAAHADRPNQFEEK